MVGENQESVLRRKGWSTMLQLQLCAAERSWKYELNTFCFSNKEVTSDSESSVCEGGMGQLWKSTVSWQVNGSSGFRESYYRQYFYEVWLGMGGKRIGRSWREIWDPGKVFFNSYFCLAYTFYFERCKKHRKAKK